MDPENFTKQMRERDEAKAKAAAKDALKLKALYYTYKRATKWATAEVYAVINGHLAHLGTARFQPGATRGLRYEVAAVAANDHRINAEQAHSVPVEEIGTNL